MGFLVEWFSCSGGRFGQSLFFSSQPSPLSHTPLILFAPPHLSPLKSDNQSVLLRLCSFSIILSSIHFFSLFLSPVPVSSPLSYSQHPHPLPPSVFSHLSVSLIVSWMSSVSAPQPLLSLSNVCQIRVSLVNGSPACHWSWAVWLAHSVLHMGHLWACSCDSHL